MKTYYVYRNPTWTRTTFLDAADITDDDRALFKKTKQTCVHTIQARTNEIADALFDAWMEREEQERVHAKGCWEKGARCWCNS